MQHEEGESRSPQRRRFRRPARLFSSRRPAELLPVLPNDRGGPFQAKANLCDLVHTQYRGFGLTLTASVIPGASFL
jgi:hypothetical protein